MLYKTIYLFLKIETLHGILKFYLFSKCYITNIMLFKIFLLLCGNFIQISILAYTRINSHILAMFTRSLYQGANHEMAKT